MSPELTAAANASISCSGLRAACRALSWEGIVEQEIKSVQDSAATAAEVLNFISVSLLLAGSSRLQELCKVWSNDQANRWAAPTLAELKPRAGPSG